MTEKMLTAGDILDILPIVSGRKWKVSDGGWVRDQAGRCPLCALAFAIDPDKAKDYYNYPFTALDIVGVKFEESAVESIMDAADNHHHSLRFDLLAALGIDKL